MLLLQSLFDRPCEEFDSERQINWSRHSRCIQQTDDITQFLSCRQHTLLPILTVKLVAKGIFCILYFGAWAPYTSLPVMIILTNIRFLSSVHDLIIQVVREQNKTLPNTGTDHPSA